MNVIAVRAELCTGCRACEMACAAKREGLANPLFARVRIVKIETRGFDYPSVCRQCAKPPCIASCKVGALKAEPGGGVQVNAESCIGCGECLGACPFGGLKFQPGANTPVVCDTCNGQAPCVERCPTKALQCLPRWRLARFGEAAAARSAAYELLPKLTPPSSHLPLPEN